MSRFYFGSPASSPSSSPRSSTDTALPFPAPLPRSDFLIPDFSPSTYLSTVAPSRHQTLEDLRSELRSRSQQLARELLDLVNAHYADFLGLGGSLKGGRERVEEVKVGLMGFEREVEGVRDKVAEREMEVGALVEERRRVRREMEKGRGLLDWAEKIAVLEGRLKVVSPREAKAGRGANAEHAEQELEQDQDQLDDSSEDEEGASGGEEDGEITAGTGAGSASSITKLNKRIQDYRILRSSAERIGSHHPFIVAQHGRLMKIRSTLLLDLSSCLRQASSSPGWKIKVMAMYRDLDAGKEAVEVLRGSKMP